MLILNDQVSIETQDSLGLVVSIRGPERPSKGTLKESIKQRRVSEREEVREERKARQGK